MQRFCANVAIAGVVALCGWAPIHPARAAPPTVTPSPGYDARLQEQRAAPTVYAPPQPADPKPAVVRHPVKRTHDATH